MSNKSNSEARVNFSRIDNLDERAVDVENARCLHNLARLLFALLSKRRLLY